MKWEGGEESSNVEDERGGGGLQPAHFALGGGGMVIVMIVGYFLGIDPAQIKAVLGNGQGQQTNTQTLPPGKEDKTHKFIAVVLGYTEKVWDEQFRKMGKTYEKPHLVIFDGQVNTRGCGPATAAVGPFYCPADRVVYIDPAFFDELENRLGGSKAEFSQAYVIAHEVGHHVQNLLGYSEIIDQKRQQLSKAEFNRWSVRCELQADYLAGVWAHYGNEKFHFIENGDAEAAIKSAYAIGDDKLQRGATGHVSPQNFTHGTSAQRVKWYKMGLDTGDFSKLKQIFDMPYEQL